MSTRVIDEKVVQMRFDNAQFESGVKKSMLSISNLTSALKRTNNIEAFNGIQEAANRVRFDKLLDSMDAIQDRFSATGIAAMRIIERATDFVVDTVVNGFNKVKQKVITGGLNRAMNIEKAKFQLEGLGIAYSDMADEIDYAVTDTAYSLDAAAMAASQLATAGLGYKDTVMYHEADKKNLSELAIALRGISGVAAQTQAPFETVARYFQDIGNAGALAGSQVTYMTQVLNMPVKQTLLEGLQKIKDGSFEASEEVKKSVDKLVRKTKLSIADIDDFLKKKSIDFRTFSTIMFDTYADHAVKANETVTGVTSNIGSAFAKIGADFLQPIVANKGPLVDLLEAFRQKINSVRAAIKPVSQYLSTNVLVAFETITDIVKKIDIARLFTFDLNNVKQAILVFKALLNTVISYLDPIKQAFEETFDIKGPTGQAIHTFLFNLADFFKSLAANEKTVEGFKRAFITLKAVFSIVMQAANALLIPLRTLFDEIIKPALGHVRGLSGGLSEFVVQLDETIRENGTFITIGNKMSDVIIKIKEVVLDAVAAMKQFYEATKERLGKIKDFFANNESIKKFGETLKQSLADNNIDVSKFKDMFGLFSEGESIFSRIAKFFANIFNSLVDVMTNAVPYIVSVGKSLSTMFSGLWDSLKNFFGEQSAGKALVNGGLFGSIIVLITKIGDISKKGGSKDSIIGKFKNILDNISSTLKEFQKSIAKNVNLKEIESCGKALALLAASVWLLTSADYGKMAEATIAVSGLMAALTQCVKSLNKDFLPLSKSLKSNTAAVEYLIGMAAAILIVSMAVKKLAKLDPAKMAGSVAAIIILMGALTEMTKALANSDGQTSKALGAAGSMVIIGVALVIFAEAAKKFAKMSWEDLGKAGAAIGALLLALGIFFVAITKFADQTSKMLGAASAMLIIGIAMITFGAAAKIFASIPSNDLIKAGIAMAAIVAGLTIFLKVTSEMSGSAGRMVGAAGSLIIMSLAIGIIALALSKLSNNTDGIGAATAALVVLIGVITAFAVILEETESGNSLLKGAAAILIMAVAIGILVPALMALSALSLGGQGGGLLILAGVLIGFAAAAAALASLAPAMIGLSLAMGLLGIACVTLAAGLTAMSGALLATAGMAPLIMQALGALISEALDMLIGLVPKAVELLTTFILSAFQGLDQTIPQLVDLVLDFIIKILDSLAEKLPVIIEKSTQLLMAMFMALAKAIEGIDPEEIMNAMKAVGILGLIFAELAVVGVLAIAATIGIAAITGALYLITTCFGFISTMNLESTLPMIDKLAGAMIKLGEAMALLAVFGVAGAVGSGAVVPAVATMVATLTALGAISQIPGFDWLMGEGMTVLTKIGTAIGEFAGSIISGFTTEASSGLPTLGNNLSAFMEGATPFIEGCKKVDDKVVNGVMLLIGAIGSFMAEGFIDNILKFFSGGEDPMQKFGTMLSQLAPMLVKFNDDIKGIDSDAVEKASLAAKSIAEFAKSLPNEGGKISEWFGDNTLSTFAKELAAFGPSFMIYAKSIEGMDTAAVKRASDAAKSIAEFTKELPNEGGVISKWIGDNTLSKFAQELAAFGPSFMIYAKSVEGMDTDAVKRASDAATSIAKFAQGLPNEGGVLASLVGDNMLSLFAEELAVFGPNFATYADAVKDLDPNIITSSANAAAALSAMAANLPNQGGLASFFAGENDMKTFGAQLASFGYALKNYYENTKGIEGNNIQSVAKGIGELAKIAVTIATCDLTKLDDFVDYTKKLNSLDTSTMVDSFIDAEVNIADSIVGLFATITENLDSQEETLQLSVKKIIDDVSTYLTTDGKDLLLGNVSTLLVEATIRVKNYYQRMYEAGTYVAQGFIEGMKSKIDNIATEAAKMAKTAYDAVMAATDSHSPSKLFKKVGGYVGEGFALGIEGYYDRVYNASETMATAAEVAMSDAMGGLVDVIDSTVDFSPTITPVLDLSEVSASAKTIGSMLNSGASINGSSIQNGGKVNADGSITYNQYNYSPKALSRIDIYRQTKNALSASRI